MDHEGTTFQAGCAVSANLLFFAKESDELVEDDTENSGFFALHHETWGKYDFVAGWTTMAMATIKPASKDRTVVAVSPGGAYWEAEPKSLHEIHGGIKEAKDSLRRLAAIDDVIYACGMARTVLRRIGPDVWEEIGPGTSPADQGLVIGFEGLSGFSGDDMYAAGWRGEIWHRKKGAWRQIDSPVSANLNAVCCAPDGKVYIVGDDGTMLRGRDDVWEVLDTGRADNLMDVAFHDKTVYVVTDFEILKLDGDSLTPEDAFADPDDLPGTCLHLLPGKDALFSMGPKDLFRLTDGAWERLV